VAQTVAAVETVAALEIAATVVETTAQKDRRLDRQGGSGRTFQARRGCPRFAIWTMVRPLKYGMGSFRDNAESSSLSRIAAGAGQGLAAR
jgi:hypothetical protein